MESEGQVPAAVIRLCDRAEVCGEPYIFISGLWVLGSTEHQRQQSRRYVAALGLYIIAAEENLTITPQGVELRHHRRRPWEE